MDESMENNNDEGSQGSFPRGGGDMLNPAEQSEDGAAPPLVLTINESSPRNSSSSGEFRETSPRSSEELSEIWRIWDQEFDDSGSNAEWLNTSSTSSDTEKESEVVRPTPKVLFKPKPKHNWFILKELYLRENGFNRNPCAFTQHFYGSLHAVERLELMYKLEEHNGCVNAINFNASGTKLVSGSDDRNVVVWDWAAGKCLSKFNTGHSGNVFQCKFLPLTGDGHIVTCSRDGQIRLAYRDSTGDYTNTTKLAQHTKACHKLTLLPQTPHVVLSAGEDALILQTDVRDSNPEKLTYVKEGKRKISLYSIHSNPMNENEICVSGDDYFIRLYDRRFIRSDGNADIKFKPKKFTKPYSVYVTCAVFNYNGTEIIGSYNDQDIYLFDTKHSSETDFIHRYEGHRNSETVKGVNFFGPKSEFIVSGSDCGHIYIWDKNTESIVQWMRGDEDGVINCIEPHPHIPVLATSGLDSDIKIWIPSCEHEPLLNGLEKTVAENISNRESRIVPGGNLSLNSTIARWWRQIRNIDQNNAATGDRQPIYVHLDALGLETFLGYNDDSTSSSSSSLSSV
ncbi:DDB1- and CUL4-associated factor 8 isoform X2 [Cimex lectularius]|uniref:Uncharacterized protein n=1 Tax=Cimex lectularius TaxID=79782 RepID=A0A8I6TLJ7_CIMLE|nr:DDB1- and CUL4-associated factor 8 isoform X2 [Cimex lectularius]